MGDFIAAAPPPRLRLGMVGGGQGAFIGGVHRMAARLDNEFELVAGALSSTADRALASGQELGLAPDRIYVSFEEMARKEAQRDDGIEVVSIVTPNHMHFAAAEAFIRQGIHIICDKPVTNTLNEARRLKEMAASARVAFVLTHNYAGYPMVRQARAMVQGGELGTIRVVQAEYAQGWLSQRLEDTGAKQAEWRTDPSRAGAGGSVGDIGTHAFHLAGYVTGLQAESLAADLDSFVPGRRLDDNAHIMMRYAGGAKGMIWTSQVAIGHENGLRLRVYGEKGALNWAQEDPNYLWFTPVDGSTRRITRAGPEAGEASARISRIPAGHPEGYLEGFASIYSEAARLIRGAQKGEATANDVSVPGIDDGFEGVAFIKACVRSNSQGANWVRLEH